MRTLQNHTNWTGNKMTRAFKSISGHVMEHPGAISHILAITLDIAVKFKQTVRLIILPENCKLPERRSRSLLPLG